MENPISSSYDNSSSYDGTTSSVGDSSGKRRSKFSIDNFASQDQSYRSNGFESNNDDVTHRSINGHTSVSNNGIASNSNTNGKGKHDKTSLFTSKKRPSIMRQRSDSLPSSTEAVRHDNTSQSADDHFYQDHDDQTSLNDGKRRKRSNIMSSMSDIYNYVKPKANSFIRKDNDNNHRETSFIN